MTKKQKKNLIRIIIALACFLVVMITNKVLESFEYYPNGLASLINDEKYGWLLPFVLFFIIYVIIGHDVIRKAFINILHGQVFDENFLMVIATFGAFGLGIYTGITTHEVEGFDEACAVYNVGVKIQKQCCACT